MACQALFRTTRSPSPASAPYRKRAISFGLASSLWISGSDAVRRLPIIAIYYTNDLEGYRKDGVTSITPIPEDKGLLYGCSGYWPFYTVDVKAAAAAGASGESGSNTGLIAGIVGVVVILGLGAFFLTRRRKSTADERE